MITIMMIIIIIIGSCSSDGNRSGNINISKFVLNWYKIVQSYLILDCVCR